MRGYEAIARLAPGLHRRRVLRNWWLGHRLRSLPFEGEGAVGQERHSRVVVEARPAPSLEVVEAKLALELLVAALDLPALLPEADRLLEGGVGRQVGEGVVDAPVLPPCHQQPARGGLGVRDGIGRHAHLPAVGRPDPDPGKYAVLDYPASWSSPAT